MFIYDGAGNWKKLEEQIRRVSQVCGRLVKDRIGRDRIG